MGAPPDGIGEALKTGVAGAPPGCPNVGTIETAADGAADGAAVSSVMLSSTFI